MNMISVRTCMRVDHGSGECAVRMDGANAEAWHGSQFVVDFRTASHSPLRALDGSDPLACHCFALRLSLKP